ncbi:MAG: helix-turn-helix domain containing protein [Desulfovibrio sp.]|jgi:hypothetical protein|nr:helix-turn-helix domain containing protein [Desulfovibrio sp.]
METYDFENALKRVFEAAECRTQVKLGDFLQVRQSSVSDAKSRKSIPAEWLIKLFDKKQISPNWILYGKGAKCLGPCSAPAFSAAWSDEKKEAVYHQRVFGAWLRALRRE